MFLHNRYNTLEILGRGGFAVTYLALDTETGQQCAIKCLSLRNIASWKTWELFEREVQILKSLDHPGIPAYIDCFKRETEQDIELYLAQEYAPGKNLAQLVQEGKHFTEHEVIEIGREITRILHYLHTFSPAIIHRDIKPENIILTPDNRIYLIDFGAIRDTLFSEYTSHGSASTIVGTYGYMPVEQFRGRVLPASDIYALGMTLIYLLSRKEPATIEKKGLILKFRPYVRISRRFAAILEKMIAPDAAKRYQTAIGVQKDLDRLAQGKIVANMRIWLAMAGCAVIMLLLGIQIGLWLSPQPLQELSRVSVSSESTPVDTVQPESPQQAPSAPSPTPEPARPSTEMVTEDAIDALTYKARALLREHNELEALLASLKAGKMLAQQDALSADHPQTLQVLREIVNTIHEKNRLQGHEYWVSSVAFSADGAYIASGSDDGFVKIWNTADGLEIHALQGHLGGIREVRFSPTGKIAASSSVDDSTIRLWDLESGTEIHKLHSSSSSNNFSPDGATLVSGCWNGQLEFWDAASGKKTFILRSSVSDSVQSIAFSPDGTLLAAGMSAGKIDLWNIPEQTRITTLAGHDKTVYSLDFRSDGAMLASGGQDHTIKLWNVAEGKLLSTLSGHTSAVRSVKFTPDGQTLASGSADWTIKFWSVAGLQEIATLKGHSQIVTDLDFNADGTLLVSGSLDRDVKLWTLANDALLYTLPASQIVQSVAFHPDTQMLAVGSDRGMLSLWDLSNGRSIVSFGKPSHPFWSPIEAQLTFGPEGKMLAYKDHLWNIADPEHIGLILKESALMLHPDGQTIVSKGKLPFSLKEIESGEFIKTFPNMEEFRSGYFFRLSPNGEMIATGGFYGILRLWSVSAGSEMFTLREKPGAPLRFDRRNDVTSLCFSPDTRILASGHANSLIYLWNTASGKFLKRLQGHCGTIMSLSFSPDGKFLLSGSRDHTLKLWDVREGREFDTLRQHIASVNGVAYSPDGTMFASGSSDETVKVWNASHVFSSDFNELLKRGCVRIQGYLKTNPHVKKEDRTICDDILNDTHEK